VQGGGSNIYTTHINNKKATNCPIKQYQPASCASGRNQNDLSAIAIP
jgi:hypothetical protein